MDSLLTNENVDESEFHSSIIELIDSLSTLDNMNNSATEANLTFQETDDIHSAEVPSVSWQYTYPEADYSSTSTWLNNSSSTTANYTLTRKRLLDTSATSATAIESSGRENYYTQQPDADEVPAKISAYNLVPLEVVSETNKPNENLLMDNKDIESKCCNVIDQWSVASTSKPNELDESKGWITNVRNDHVPMYENIHRSKGRKSNVNEKNRIEQLKYILMMMKGRSDGWSLTGVLDLDVNHFCDGMHHFEIKSQCICALIEVKFFDVSNKTKKLNYKSMFSDEFNIQRYFRIFCEYERSCFSNQQSKIIIMTNRQIDVSSFRRKNIRVSCENNRYTLKVEAQYEECKFYKKCLECFDLLKLAKYLHELVHCEYKLVYLNVNLIRKYHLALVNEKVLQITNNLENHEKVAKFHPHFIEAIELTNAAMELRYHLIQFLGGLPTDCMSFTILRSDFGEDVASSRFPETVHCLPDENSKETFEHFFKVFEIVKITKMSDQTIVAELGEKFLKLDHETYFTAVLREISISLNNRHLQSNTIELLKHTISKTEVIEKISQRIIPQINVAFDQFTFPSLLCEIAIENIVLCSTQSIQLSELKIRQFSKYLGYTENQESLFITDEILFQMADNVVEAFSQRSINLLVITWHKQYVIDPREAQLMKDLIQRFRNVIQTTPDINKSIIFIADKENLHLSLPHYQIYKIEDNLKWTFSN